MLLRQTVAASLIERFGAGVVRPGSEDPTIAVFPGRHPLVGDAVVRDATAASAFRVTIGVGGILEESVLNFDSHLDERERATRVARDAVWFLTELFADRLLLWRATDGRGPAWRQRGDGGPAEPLVLDNRVYERYLWSGPLPVWQAVPAIIGRGRIESDREYEIAAILLTEGGPNLPGDSEREALARLVEAYRLGRS